MTTSNLADVIIEEFGLPERPKTSVIPKQKVLDWMDSDDVEALGALYSFATDPNYSGRIQPGMTFWEYWKLISRYFERCFHENPSGEWAHGRYDAGWDLAGWFVKIWQDQTISEDAKTEIKQWLGKQYVMGNAEVRRCLVDSVFEHIFEKPDIARYFSDWKTEPDLSMAYGEAAEWVKEGGQTHFGKQ